MAESISPPPASGGGSAKYLIVLLLLLGGGLGIFLATRSAEPPPQAAAAPPPKNAERPTSLADNQLEIPVEEPDAGTAKVEPDQPKKSRGGRGDSWACQGDLPPQDIRAVLNDSSVQIRSCYERRLRVDNLLQGNVSMQVRIGADGKVQATRVRGNMRDGEVKTCMQNIAKKWTFPPPSGGNCAVFEAPYAFTPKQ